MRLELTEESRVRVRLRATGVVRSLMAHDRLLTGRPRLRRLLEISSGSETDVEVAAELPATSIEPADADLSAGDRRKILTNLRGDRVLDADRHPVIEFSGAYRGGAGAGELRGDVLVRGRPQPIVFDVELSESPESWRAVGSWTGALRELGIKPFKALLGTIRLEDWIRVELDLEFRRSG